MNIGDEVIVSDKNPNHLGFGVCAYAGMKGKVIEIWEDNAFALDCGGSTLVVPMVIYGSPKNYWIWINGKLTNWKGKKCSTNLSNNQDTLGNPIQSFWAKIRAILKESCFKTLKR
jgi:hypothetical protein